MLKLQNIFVRKNAVLPKLLKDIVGKTSNPSLYLEAITHVSLNRKEKNYQRLEFLGDSILSSIVSEFLYLQKPDSDEGDLSKTRSKIVSRKYLNRVGKELKLSETILKEPNTLLPKDIDGNLLESIVGAMFLDKGYTKTKAFVLDKILSPKFNKIDFENELQSFKSILHEWSQKERAKINFYTYKEESSFCCKLTIDDWLEFFAKGTSKKNAEENASELAWKEISKIKQ